MSYRTIVPWKKVLTLPFNERPGYGIAVHEKSIVYKGVVSDIVRTGRRVFFSVEKAQKKDAGKDEWEELSVISDTIFSLPISEEVLDIKSGRFFIIGKEMTVTIYPLSLTKERIKNKRSRSSKT